MSTESTRLREAADSLEQELLARLGLGRGASNEQIESAHEEIAQFLDRAPAVLRGWAVRQTASIDEAWALLRGDAAQLTVLAAARLAVEPSAASAIEPSATSAIEPSATSAIEPSATSAIEPSPGSAAEPSTRALSSAQTVSPSRLASTEAQSSKPVAPAPKASRPSPAPTVAESGVVLPHGGRHQMDDLDDAEDWLDETDLESTSLESTSIGRTSGPARRAERRRRSSRSGDTREARLNPILRRVGLVVAGAIAIVAIGVGGYALGAPKASPAPTTDPQTVALQQQVATLMQTLAENPADLATLNALGNVYYQAQDYQSAADWMKKALAVDPKHLDSLLAYGAATYNLADYATAETSWKQVLELDPSNLEAYYDLGFLYFSDNPPDIERTRQMWNKVVELSPDSQIAKTVASHLESLDALASGSPAPASSPEPTASASPSASASSPVPSR